MEYKLDDTYPLYQYNIGIDYHHIKNRDRDTKKEKSNNKSSECNTRIKYTYPLYKYNIGINYHQIKNRDDE